MKTLQLVLLAAAVYAGPALAQGTELTDQQILERFQKQLELRQAEAESTTPSQPQTGLESGDLGAELGVVGLGPATAVERRAHGVGDMVGHSQNFELDNPGITEVRVIQFNSAADADRYIVEGDLEGTIEGDFAFEQRGPFLAVVIGPDAADATKALEAMRQAWNAVTRATGNHLIPPVRTRYARANGGVVVETEIDHPGFVQYFDSLEYSDVPTEFEDGVRRIHQSEAGYANALRLTDSDRSPLRSRGDEGVMGRTRGLQLGGGGADPQRTPTEGVGKLLEDSFGN